MLRRFDKSRQSPAEQAITDALLAIETAGCDERLTRASLRLMEARELVADVVDKLPPAPNPKTLHNSTVSQAKDNVADLRIVGNGNMFRLLCKASSEAEGWMKSTKAMEISGVGCVVQVTTQQGEQVAEAICFVPGVTISEDENGGRKLLRCEP